MKKILSFLLAFCMIFGSVLLSSCAYDQDTSSTSSTSSESSTSSTDGSAVTSEQARLLSSAVEKVENAEKYSARLSVVVNLGMGETTVAIPLTIDMAVKNAKSENPIFYATSKLVLLGQTTKNEVYCDGAWNYISSAQGNYKAKIEDSLEYDYVGDIQNVVKELPEDALALAGFKIDKDGTTEISVSLSDALFEQIFKDAIDSVKDVGYEEIGDMKISKGTVKIAIDKTGAIKYYQLNFNLKMTVEEIETSSSVQMKLEFKDFGEITVVNPIEGYESFKELT